ncbi:hypothetical protein [Neobacillus drentensis]|uniref:hypothetical protein n=1 Tax=Neobacillus drentensis TaxID=220684 RepID=UPI002FFE642B
MEKKQAIFLANCIEGSKSPAYDINKLEVINGCLPKFHQWTNGKPTIAAFEITRPDNDTGYYFVFIDWHRNDNYYLVIYAHDHSTTCAEIRQIQEIDGVPHLIWTYQPLKRDGKNQQRKAYFKQMFGATTIQIKLPSSALDLDVFLGQIFKLCQNRIKADRIVEVFEIE